MLDAVPRNLVQLLLLSELPCAAVFVLIATWTHIYAPSHCVMKSLQIASCYIQCSFAGSSMSSLAWSWLRMCSPSPARYSRSISVSLLTSNGMWVQCSEPCASVQCAIASNPTAWPGKLKSVMPTMWTQIKIRTLHVWSAGSYTASVMALYQCSKCQCNPLRCSADAKSLFLATLIERVLISCACHVAWPSCLDWCWIFDVLMRLSCCLTLRPGLTNFCRQPDECDHMWCNAGCSAWFCGTLLDCGGGQW